MQSERTIKNILWPFLVPGLLVLVASVFGLSFGQWWIGVIPLAAFMVWLLLYKTTWYFFAICIFVPLSVQLENIGYGLGIALPSEPMIMGLFGMLLLKLLLKGGFDKKIIKHPMSIMIIIGTAWILISTISSSMPMVSFKFFMNRFWYVGVFYFFAIYLMRDAKNIHWFFITLTISIMVVVFITLGRHAAENFVRSHSYSIMQPFFREHGTYAATLAFFVPFLSVYLFSGKHFNLTFPMRAVAGVILVVLLFGIVVSFTRAAWLSLLLALAMFMWLKYKVKFRWLVLGVVMSVGYFTLNYDKIIYSLERNKQGSADELESHLESVSNITTDPSNLERINRWNSAMKMTEARPIFGFGPGTFVFQYAPFQSSKDLTIISVNSGTLGDAHSEYFSALSEQGIPGLLFLLALIYFVFLRSFRIIYTAPKPFALLAMAAFLGLITYFFHGLMNNYSVYDKVAVPFWGFMAIITAIDIYHSKQPEDTLQQTQS